MGLDMYLYGTKDSQVTAENFHDAQGTEELGYWRKHNALHGWFFDKWVEEGNDPESFNCCYMELTRDNVLTLLLTIQNSQLTQREGFFWGSIDLSGAYYAQDIETFVKALDYMDEGGRVFYHPWW